MLLIPGAVSRLISHRPRLHLPHIHLRYPHGHNNDAEKDGHHNFIRPGGRSAATRRRRPEIVMVGDSFQSMLEGDLSTALHGDVTYRTLPIFSGIMIPFSIMLSIPGLTGHWYVRTGDNNAVLESRPNPLLLDLATGLSVGCGVLACASLVVRFAERRIRLMTLLSIAFLTLHDLINIPAVTIFGIEHRFDDGFTYGQSFWMTVCSTLVSTATNITLIIDYRQTQDFKHSGSGLTPKQRSLVIIIIILLCYVSLGALIQSFLLHLSFIDALYFSVVSIESIGFGDIPLKTTASHVFTCCYIAVGILNLALAVALAREALLEAAALSFRDRLKAVRQRQREKRIRTRWRAAIRWRLQSKGLPVWIDHQNRPRRHSGQEHHWYNCGRRLLDNLYEQFAGKQEGPSIRHLYGNRHRRLNLEVLTEAQLESAALEAGAPLCDLIPEGLQLLENGNDVPNDGQAPVSRVPFTRRPSEGGLSMAPTRQQTEGGPWTLTHVRLGGMVSLISRFHVRIAHPHHDNPNQLLGASDYIGDDDDDEGSTSGPNGVPLSSAGTLQDDDHSFVATVQEEERNAFYARLGIALTMFVVFWTAGAAIFMQTEGWSYGIAIYFCFISFTTVGYGDFSPKTPAGRSIFVVWALLGVGTMTILISILAEAYSTRYKSIIKSEVDQAAEQHFNDPTFKASLSGSRTAVNTATDQEFPSSPSSVQPSVVGSAFSPPTTPRLRRSRGPSMAPIPELRLTLPQTKIAPTMNESQTSSLEGLPHALLKHVETLRTLMSTMDEDDVQSEEPKGQAAQVIDMEKMKTFLAQLDESLNDIECVAREALESFDTQPTGLQTQ